MKCQKCGAMLPDNFKFCIKCGCKLETDVQPVQPQAAYNPMQGKKPISDKHFSLEDIAKQQERNSDIRFSSIASVSDKGSVDCDGENSGNPPRQETDENETENKETAKWSKIQSTDSTLLYNIKAPAVPMGKQIQVCFSVFDKDASEKLEDILRR